MAEGGGAICPDAASAPAAVTRDGVKIILLGDSAVGKSKLVE
eukprot:COSAG06_NODE_44340_length_364_cov_0.852830_1_plen_41_part_01